MKKIVRGKTILTLSTGNKKLVSNRTHAFLIWNLPAITTCPKATTLCKKYCYAMKAQRIYPSVRRSRAEQLADSRDPKFLENMTNTINYFLEKKSRKDGNIKMRDKKVFFRIHESGDFVSQSYYDNWVRIAQEFPEINFLAYTKSIGFVAESKLERPKNLVIRFSVWADTTADQIELARELDLPIFTAFEPAILADKVTNENYSKCNGNCKVCKKCYTNKNKRIAIAIH